MSTVKALAPIVIPILLILALLGLGVKRIADLGNDITKVTATPNRLKRGTAHKPGKKKEPGPTAPCRRGMS